MPEASVIRITGAYWKEATSGQLYRFGAWKRNSIGNLPMPDDDKEKLAAWMIKNGFATGHGDSIEDLLGELTWQFQELRDGKCQHCHKSLSECRCDGARIQRAG
jgi:hypothetical protein